MLWLLLSPFLPTEQRLPFVAHSDTWHSAKHRLLISPNLIAWFVFRGGGTGGPCPSKDSWKFSANNKEWTKLPECSNPRMYTSMAMLPPLNGSERRAVLYAGQEKSISVLGVIKTVIVCVKKQVKLDWISNSSYTAVSVRLNSGKMWPTRKVTRCKSFRGRKNARLQITYRFWPDSSLLEKWREIFKRIISETAISSILNYSNN